MFLAPIHFIRSDHIYHTHNGLYLTPSYGPANIRHLDRNMVLAFEPWPKDSHKLYDYVSLTLTDNNRGAWVLIMFDNGVVVDGVTHVYPPNTKIKIKL